MMTFVEKLAEALLKEHDEALGNVAVVLPSQRAGLYLRDALARRAGKALWSPEVFTLSSFMERLSGLRVLPMEELLFEAFEAYRSVAGDDVRSLEDFMEWSPVTISDMSEADAGMVRLEGFYRDLRSWDDIDWSFNIDPLSAGQQRMVRYWSMAGKFHKALNDRLLAQNLATSGLAARAAAEKGTTDWPWKRVWFAGLNAFTVAEGRVLDAARDSGSARFAWDADRYYLAAMEQEAGEHLRTAIARYGLGVVPIGDNLGRQGPSIAVLRSPNAVAQAWCAASHLLTLTPEARANTAILLADEHLLPALLEALPSGTGPVNVTMGLALAALPIGSLVESFFRVYSSSEGTGMWNTGLVLDLLRHPFLRAADDPAAMDEAIRTILAGGLHGIGGEAIVRALAGLGARTVSFATGVFAPDRDAPARTRLVALLAWARTAVGQDAFVIEQVYKASIALGKAADLLERYGHSSHGAVYASVMTRLLRTARIGLFGEPLAGLQIMGLLEARGLDPRHIIVLGAQEGKLPAPSLERSYVPFELRRAYGLPSRDSGDAVQAYNFLRTLQGAEDVMLVYDEQGAANGPSRFIAQLRHELYGEGRGAMVFLNARVPVPVSDPPPLVIPNDEETRARIGELLRRGLSPSALRAWLRCPLDFWFRYVRGLREPDVSGVRIGGDVMGNVLHGLLEDIHRPWLGDPLVAGEVEAATHGLGEALGSRFASELGTERISCGQPLLQLGMATRAAENFLRGEARLVRNGARIIPLALESELHAPLSVEGIPECTHATIRGRLDRVDDRDGVLHILDLKTGRVDEGALRIKEISLDALKGEKGYAAQLLVYAWLYMTLHPEVNELRTGLQPLQRAKGSTGLYLRVGDRDRIDRADIQAMTRLLASVLRTLSDPSTTFAHDPESAYCAFCAQRE